MSLRAFLAGLAVWALMIGALVGWCVFLDRDPEPTRFGHPCPGRYVGSDPFGSSVPDC